MAELKSDLSAGLQSDKVFMIMAGGTGGHIFPGLAVADILKQRGFSIHWLGTYQGMEATLVPKHHFPISFLSVKGVRGKGISALLMAPWRIINSTIQAMRIMKHIRPVGVLGMGGFASGPGSLAARLLGIPLIIHEQNAVEGITNRLAAPMAKKILVAFPEAFSSSKKVIFTGNPVRSTINYTQAVTSANEAALADEKQSLHVLILGGSRGALSINETVPEAIALLNKDIDVWHQTGANHDEVTKKHYKKCHVEATIEPFIDNMAAAYAWADLVICRSGALTIAELANAGKPSILVPYPWHKDQQQLRNAEYLVKNEAALLIQQKELTAKALAKMIEYLYEDRRLLKAMGRSAYSCAKPEAAKTIATICEDASCG